MKGGELCAAGDALSGYNSADCVSGRCMDWIGSDTQCSRVCYSLKDEPCELRSSSIWNSPGDHTHVAGAGRDMSCIGPESGFELSCWQNVCTDKPPKGATCYTDVACQNTDPDTMCEQGVCTKMSAIPGGAICRNHAQCNSGHCWEWYVCFFELSLASLDTTYTRAHWSMHPSPFTCAQVRRRLVPVWGGRDLQRGDRQHRDQHRGLRRCARPRRFGRHRWERPRLAAPPRRTRRRLVWRGPQGPVRQLERP